MSDADDARFQAFMVATDAKERAQIAFWEFESAIHNAVGCASMINMYDAGPEGEREQAGLKIAITEMFFRVLPRVDLGTLIGQAEGIGYALRYGVLEPIGNALDSVADTKAFEELAERGYAAERADVDRRVTEQLESPELPSDEGGDASRH